MIASPNAPTSTADSASADPALLQAALAAQKDDYLRLAADFDNFRKRTRRDSEQQAAAEKESFILDLLPVLDDLERALSFEQMYQGVAMTLHRLAQLIHRHGIEAVEDLGRPFDPHRHEAVSLGHDPTQLDTSTCASPSQSILSSVCAVPTCITISTCPRGKLRSARQFKSRLSMDRRP